MKDYGHFGNDNYISAITGNQLFNTLSFQPLTSLIVTVFYFPNEKNRTVYVTPQFPIRPEWRIRTEPGARNYMLGLIDLFFIRVELVPVGIRTISVITKIIYIYKRTTIGVVPIKIYTHILRLIYLYKPLYVYMSNTNIRDCGSSAVSTYL